MGKITKCGKVDISEDDILIAGFEYDGEGKDSQDDATKAILVWAIKQILREL